MPDGRRGEHGLIRVEKLPLYVAGMLTETAFILALTLVALLLAAVAIALVR